MQYNTYVYKRFLVFNLIELSAEYSTCCTRLKIPIF